MKPDFREITAKIIADFHTRTFYDDFDGEILEEILRGALIKYCRELDGYYDAGYAAGWVNGKSSLEGDVDSAYDEGYTLGYSEGYSEGHSLMLTALRLR